MSLKSFFLKAVNGYYKYSVLKQDINYMFEELLFKERENMAFQNLLNLIGSESYIPYTNMAMSPLTIAHIMNEIIVNNRRSIIEFGSGNSTIFIAKLLQSLGTSVQFYSIESDENWINILRNDLKKRELDEYVKFVHAPIREQLGDATFGSSIWYNTSILKEWLSNQKFDTVIVDGPPGWLCPYSRYPAIPFIKDYLENEYVVFMDDYNREEEKLIFKNWIKILGSPKHAFEKRYAVISGKPKFLSTPL